MLEIIAVKFLEKDGNPSFLFMWAEAYVNELSALVSKMCTIVTETAVI